MLQQKPHRRRSLSRGRMNWQLLMIRLPYSAVFLMLIIVLASVPLTYPGGILGLVEAEAMGLRSNVDNDDDASREKQLRLENEYMPANPNDPKLLEALRKMKFRVGDSTELPPRRIEHYSSTVRRGGLEGPVGQNLKYNSPKTFTEEAFRIFRIVQQAARLPLSKKSNVELTPLLRVQSLAVPLRTIDNWSNEIPAVKFIVTILNHACSSKLPSGGVRRFARCLEYYMYTLQNNYKRDLGTSFRALLASKEHISILFDKNTGLCPPVVAALELPDRFCVELAELLNSIPQFLAASDLVQVHEKRHYGADKISMLQITGINENNIALSSSECRLILKDLWNVFGTQVMKTEAENQTYYWYLDPIHKWRYAVALTMYFISASVQLSLELLTPFSGV